MIPVQPSLQSHILALMSAASVPGMSIAMVRGGELAEVLALGVRDKQTKEPVSAETTFEAASLSKPVVAHAVLQLVDAGELELDEPLARFASPITAQDPFALRITARHVLSHTTGLPNWRRDEYPLRTYFPPGSRFSYSGEGFVYLQSVIERLTSEPLGELVRRLVLEPFEMTGSSYVWQERFARNYAVGHDDAGRPLAKYMPAQANAAYSLHTTAADYARFLAAALSGSRLKETTARQSFTAQAHVPSGRFEALEVEAPKTEHSVAWGLGWGLEPDRGAFFQWGANPGAQAFALGSNRERCAVVIFTNSDKGLTIVPDIIACDMPGEHPSLRWLGLR